MENKTNKAKLEFFKFSENRLNRKAIAFNKIGGNCALSAYSMKIHLLGYFCMQNSAMKTVHNPMTFMKNARIENMINFSNCC